MKYYLVMIMNKDDGRILNIAMNSIQEGYRKSYLSNEMSKKDFATLLKYSYLYFKSFSSYQGLANDMVVSYLREIKTDIELEKPWLWLTNKNKVFVIDDDIDELLLAQALYISKINKNNDLNYKNEIEKLLDRVLDKFDYSYESIKYITNILQWLTWMDVKSEKLYIVQEMMKRVVKNYYNDNKWLTWMYFYNKNVYSDFHYLDRVLLKYEYFIPLKSNNLNIRKYIIKTDNVEMLYIDDFFVIKYCNRFKIFGQDMLEIDGISGELQAQTWKGVLRYLKKNGKDLKLTDKLYMIISDYLK